MANALKKIETKAMQIGHKFSPEKCGALWYRSVDPDWNFKIAGVRIPWLTSVKYLGVITDKRLDFKKQVDYVRKKTDRKMNLLKSTELTIGRQRKYSKEYLHSDYTINTGVRSSYLRNDGS